MEGCVWHRWPHSGFEVILLAWETLCNFKGKLRPYNIENHLVATHLCQQMRNSFLPVPWEELPKQVLQLCSPTCHRHSSSSAGRGFDKLSREKKQGASQEIKTMIGSLGVEWMQQEWSSPPGKRRKGREGREALWSSQQSGESKLTSKEKIQSKHVLVPASLLS